MSEKTLPLFWGYITKSKKMILLAYQHKSQITRAGNHPAIHRVICPFRAKDMVDAQSKISKHYGNFTIHH